MRDTSERPTKAHFSIRYLSRYVYDADIVDNMNALRVRPASTARQQVEDFSVRLTPDVRQYGYTDYFGTEVVEFEVTRPHRELVIDAQGHVSTEAQPLPSSAGWEQLLTPAYIEAAAEYVTQTDDAPGHPLLASLQAGTDAASTPLQAATLTAELIPARLEYRRGATFVDSALVDVLDIGAGVCQDFVHIALNMLRRRGIAARYVSGYLYAASEDVEDATEQGPASLEVDTHAWLEVLIPRPDGEATWVGIDPTNRSLADERHVKIGHGRQYADVPPIKGVYRGSAGSKLEARVTMRRVEPMTGPPRPVGAPAR
jgi:transglutaminase-like putative cysteine protease